MKCIKEKYPVICLLLRQVAPNNFFPLRKKKKKRSQRATGHRSNLVSTATTPENLK